MSRKLFQKILICGSFPIFIVGTLYAKVTIADNGKPQSVIVLGEKPTRSAQLAARELRHHIKLITGAELQIIKENEKHFNETQEIPEILEFIK